tara:strand:+ start:766 stop:996 length:231 start_codon:yes stop_codon:yes gene_type:complete
MKDTKKHTIKVDVESNEVTLYLNTEFGYSIHSFDISDGEVEILDRRKFTLIAQVLGTSGRRLEQQIEDAIEDATVT